MKRKISICLVVLQVMLLCGCQSSHHLGDRAIVKAVYLNNAQDGMIEAALVVFTCEPSTDTASVEGEAKIYSATGRSIEEAIRLAEQKQNKKPFYAQNEMLLLGAQAVESDVTPFLTYFGQEDAAQPNLGVFVTPHSADEFAECEPVIQNVITEGERLIQAQSAQGSVAHSIYEIQPEEEGIGGWLPVLTFSQEEGTFVGVRALLLLEKGKAYDVLTESEMQLAMLLAGKQTTLTLHEEVSGSQLSCETQRLRVEKDVYNNCNIPHLTVTIAGGTRQITRDGETLQGEQAQEAMEEINLWIEQHLQIVQEKTFRRGNDVFKFCWWLRMNDAKTTKHMEEMGDIYKTNCISLASKLTITH